MSNGLARPIHAVAGVARGSLGQMWRAGGLVPAMRGHSSGAPHVCAERRATVPQDHRPLLTTRTLVIILLAAFCGGTVAVTYGAAAGLMTGIAVAAALHGLVA